jgi:hypothetical protein
MDYCQLTFGKKSVKVAKFTYSTTLRKHEGHEEILCYKDAMLEQVKLWVNTIKVNQELKAPAYPCLLRHYSQ